MTAQNSSPNYRKLSVNVPRTQSYLYRNEYVEILCPLVGSILNRTVKKTGSSEMFVVFDRSMKSKGNNKGVIDLIRLESIDNIDVDDNTVFYKDTDYPLVLKLTNHGQWWNKRLLSEFSFEWVTDLREKLDSKKTTRTLPIPIELTSPGNKTEIEHSTSLPKPTIEGWSPPKTNIVPRLRRWSSGQSSSMIDLSTINIKEE